MLNVPGQYVLTADDDPVLNARLDIIAALALEKDQVLGRQPVDKDAVRALITKYEAAGLKYYSDLRQALKDRPIRRKYGAPLTSEAVMDCIRRNGEILPIDIVKELGCSRSTLFFMMKALRQKGLIIMDRGRAYRINSESEQWRN